MPVIKSGVGSFGVASDHPLASKIGVEILEKGGNAFDAAIAVSAALSVLQPQMSGLGGDGFLLAFTDSGVVAYNGSGRSPISFNGNEYISQRPERGPLTITVPGLVDLWGFIHDEYASLTLEELLSPAIKLAENGFRVGSMLSRSIESYRSELKVFNSWNKLFGGLSFGDLFVNRDLARVLKIISRRGWDEFYVGRLAEEIVASLQRQGVDIDLEDFMEHEGFEVEPVKMEIDGNAIYELPPNTQGISTLQAISALYELELYKLDIDDPGRIDSWREPWRNIYMFRNSFVGDPESIDFDISEYVSYSKAIEKLKSHHRASSSAVGSGDTTFFTVVDREGNQVGFIQSIFYPFGSGIATHGFVMQNRGRGFLYERGKINSPEPRKRPMHTLSILAVDSGKYRYIIGCAGGDYRPQIHVQVYEYIFLRGLDIGRAVDAPRFIYTDTESLKKVVVEKRLRGGGSSGLEYITADYYGRTGLVNASQYRIDNSFAWLVSDPRSEGVAIGR